MNFGLKDKIAFVGGGSSGLGEAVARSLAAEGATLILSARHAEKLQKTAEEIALEFGVKTFVYAADTASEADLEKISQQVLERFGKVDILFHNTGGPVAGKFNELSLSQWDQAYQQLLRSAVFLTEKFLPGMQERKWGRIIFSTSVAVKQPQENLMLSNSLRAAVTGFARTLANETGKDGVTVNCVLPGYTQTQRLDGLAKKAAQTGEKTEEEVRQGWEKSIPMGRLGKPEEFAAAVAFLASTQASYITGQSICVDGGYVGSLL